MTRLVWDDRALDDLTAIADYIAADSPRTAARVVEYNRTAARTLESFSDIGLASPEQGLREFILTRFPYVLIYEPKVDEVRILAIFHHRQQRR